MEIVNFCSSFQAFFSPQAQDFWPSAVLRIKIDPHEWENKLETSAKQSFFQKNGTESRGVAKRYFFVLWQQKPNPKCSLGLTMRICFLLILLLDLLAILSVQSLDEYEIVALEAIITSTEGSLPADWLADNTSFACGPPAPWTGLYCDDSQSLIQM